MTPARGRRRCLKSPKTEKDNLGKLIINPSLITAPKATTDLPWKCLGPLILISLLLSRLRKPGRTGGGRGAPKDPHQTRGSCPKIGNLGLLSQRKGEAGRGSRLSRQRFVFFLFSQ